MTHHEIRTLPDGTRRYSNGTRYKLKAPDERTYGVRRPDNPDAVRFHGKWFEPLQLLPDEERVRPETLPDELTLEHKASCICRVCRRPEAKKYWRRARWATP